MARVIVALGSNEGDRARTIDAALEAICRLPMTSVVARSGNHETEPEGGPPQGRVLNAAAGEWIRINVAGVLAEYRRIDVVGTAGAGGTGLQFRDPLLKAHANGVAVVETVGDGKTEITPGIVRRQPLSAYNDFVLVAQSPSDYYELYLYNSISKTDAAEVTFGNESMAAIKVSLGTRRDGANLALPSWRLRIPAA